MERRRANPPLWFALICPKSSEDIQLLNNLLRHNQGLRLAVLVNDFGDINIDADLVVNNDG
jgi:glutamate mutase epsilon subunit